MARRRLRATKSHPANLGRLCVKAALPQTGRRHAAPSIHDRRRARLGSKKPSTLSPTGFVRRFPEHGPDSSPSTCRGQILTEDYYVANKLMKGFIGRQHHRHEFAPVHVRLGRRPQAGLRVGHSARLLRDLDQADLVVLVGSISPGAIRSCSSALPPRAKSAGGLPRRQHRSAPHRDQRDRRPASSIAPGADVALFLGLLDRLEREDLVDRAFVAAHTSGFDDAALTIAREWPLDRVARQTGLPGRRYCMRFYEMFASTERTVTVYSQGVNQSSAGVDKVNTILNAISRPRASASPAWGHSP